MRYSSKPGRSGFAWDNDSALPRREAAEDRWRDWGVDRHAGALSASPARLDPPSLASDFAVIDLGALDGSDGFRITGTDAYDRSGFSVSSAGDVNGDGFDDVIIGAYGADGGGDSDAGESYVVFGQAGGFSARLKLADLDGSNGFRVDGVDVDDKSGRSVSGAGDINGDGFDDVIIGAYAADKGSYFSVGESYVVFGKASGFAASVES